MPIKYYLEISQYFLIEPHYVLMNNMQIQLKPGKEGKSGKQFSNFIFMLNHENAVKSIFSERF